MRIGRVVRGRLVHTLFLVQVQASSYLSPIPAHNPLLPSAMPVYRLRAEMEHERSEMRIEAVQLCKTLSGLLHNALLSPLIPDCRLRAEMEHERSEMHNEAVQLRRVVEDQSQQVAALKMHAERMAVEAQKAQERVGEGWSKGGGSGLRVKGSIRGGGEG